MKKCPFCAEEIQAKAIKCKHCGEFLDGSKLSPQREDKLPWYFRTSYIVFALCAVGPLALPMLWFRPKTSLVWKVGLTIGVLVLSWMLYVATMESLRTLEEYYLLMDEL